jgi:hypothetical protein
MARILGTQGRTLDCGEGVAVAAEKAAYYWAVVFTRISPRIFVIIRIIISRRRRMRLAGYVACMEMRNG